MYCLYNIVTVVLGNIKYSGIIKIIIRFSEVGQTVITIHYVYFTSIHKESASVTVKLSV